MSMESLPDEVLAAIGISVARLCGLGDFVNFSLASKRLKSLLVDSETTLAEVARVRISAVKRLLSGITNSTTTAITTIMRAPEEEPLSASWCLPVPTDLRTIEELWFFECFYRAYFEFYVNYSYSGISYIPHRDFATRKYEGVRAMVEQTSDIFKRVLRNFSSATMCLDSHVSNRQAVNGPTSEDSETATLIQSEKVARYYSGFFFYEGVPRKRVEYRAWGKHFDREGPEPDHVLVYQHSCQQWVEAYVRLPRKGGLEPLELPPRSKYYEGVTADFKLQMPR